MPQSLDAYDRKILRFLQANGGASTAEVGEAVGLSQSPCWRRIRRLEDDGVIRDRVALLDRDKLGLSVLVFAHVKLETHQSDALDDFKRAIAVLPEVQECYVLMGEVDFLLRVVAKDIKDYERLFFDRLSQLPAVREINSMIAVSTTKETSALPIADMPV
ncbi:Lrp/AsnC family transcriptional regulator [Eilatimonas milleporae]|uniref:AsnC family transcriptional regulator n=1 Tax=Eilatimonas milleporae TaxID=911205 RepID=A0A3M0CXS7_9PROT|nr:Lrp/AsnC family transcriptional regulator [Eilatimonas milleporae]RMB12396.1 AsnC family transcriptional regulator [Eilatimonas milleporae]